MSKKIDEKAGNRQEVVLDKMGLVKKPSSKVAADYYPQAKKGTDRSFADTKGMIDRAMEGRNIDDKFNQGKAKIARGIGEQTTLYRYGHNLGDALADDAKQVKDTLKFAKDLVTNGKAEMPEPESKQKAKEKIKEGLSDIGDAFKAKARKELDRVKKKLKKLFNHPEWYTRFPEFITTNLNFGVRKEAKLFQVAAGANYSFIQTMPQAGGALAQTYIDQLNLLFAKLRGSNSGAFNYTAEDVMAYIECVRGIRIGMHHLRKVLKAANNIDLYINKTPDPMLLICGIDASNIQALKDNRANYIARYNQLAEIVEATFPLPPQMAVFDRDQYIASVILEDGKGPKSSVYTYVPQSVILAGGANDKGKIRNSGIVTNSVSGLIGSIETLINAAHSYVSNTYQNADTFAKIAGDVFKAYGQAALSYSIERLDLNSKNQIVFDEYLLHQMQNAATLTYVENYNVGTLVYPMQKTYSFDIKIAGNTSYGIPLTRIPGCSHPGSVDMTINTNKSDISGGEALSLTRGNVTFKHATATTITYGSALTVDVDTCDTIVFSHMTMFRFNVDGNIYTSDLRVKGVSATATFLAASEHSIWTQLDYAPAYYIYDDNNNNGTFTLNEDIDTFAYMSADQYRAFTDTVILSLYKTVDISDQVNFRSVKR